MKFSVYDLILAVIGFAMGKLLAFGLSWPDAFAIFSILATLHATTVIEHLFPKRPDLHKLMDEVGKKIEDIKNRNEYLERDITALKFGASRK